MKPREELFCTHAEKVPFLKERELNLRLYNLGKRHLQGEKTRKCEYGDKGEVLFGKEVFHGYDSPIDNNIVACLIKFCANLSYAAV